MVMFTSDANPTEELKTYVNTKYIPLNFNEPYQGPIRKIDVERYEYLKNFWPDMAKAYIDDMFDADTAGEGSEDTDGGDSSRSFVFYYKFVMKDAQKQYDSDPNNPDNKYHINPDYKTLKDDQNTNLQNRHETSIKEKSNTINLSNNIP